MPDVFPGIRLERHDRGREKIVPAARAAHSPVPGSPVAHPDVERIELRVIRHGIPNGSATANFPPLAVPGLRGLFENRAFEWLCRIAWHRVKAPRQFARVRVIGGDVASHAHFRTAVADEHFALYDARRAGDGVTRIAVDRECFPNEFSVGRVERHQPAVQRAHENFPPPDRHAAIHHVAARVHRPRGRNFRIVRPQPLARRRLHRKDLAPGSREVHHSIDDDGSRLLPASRVQINRPRQPELADILIVDQFQRTEALFVVRPPMAHPVSRLLIRMDQPGFIHRRSGSRSFRP